MREEEEEKGEGREISHSVSPFSRCRNGGAKPGCRGVPQPELLPQPPRVRPLHSSVSAAGGPQRPLRPHDAVSSPARRWGQQWAPPSSPPPCPPARLPRPPRAHAINSLMRVTRSPLGKGGASAPLTLIQQPGAGGEVAGCDDEDGDSGTIY